MSGETSVQGNRGGPLRLAIVAIFASALLIFALGCCDTFCPPPTPAATHSIAFAIDTTRCPCDDAKCVCPVPTAIHVDRGDTIQFVNASPYDVTMAPAVPDALNPPGSITVASGQTVQVTVSDTAPVGSGFALNMTVVAPGWVCPGLPGPRVDIDN